MFRLCLLCTATVACSPPPDAPAPSTSTSSSTSTSGSTSAETSPTADTAPELPTFDCDTVPLAPVSGREVPGARGYHDLAFDAQGGLIGASTSGDLLRVDFDGNAGVLVPNLGTVQQMAWLPDGDLAVASDERGVLRVTPAGGVQPIASVFAYGLVTGPDGMLYAADQRLVVRIDPDTGDVRTLVEEGALDRGSPRVLAFDRTYERLLIGTLGGSQGRLYAIPLDADLEPAGPPEVFATGVGTGGYHDALGVDLCGYLYVPDYNTSAVYRVHPTSGQVQLLFDAVGFLNDAYGHGLEWGSGVGGWLDQAIYLPRPYANNKVTEVVIGVPSRDAPEIVPVNLP
ncbi:MAG: hypothetical protein R3F59_38855 [Myxococcota bacterium]